jgi:CheY-like chemotaxis protein
VRLFGKWRAHSGIKISVVSETCNGFQKFVEGRSEHGREDIPGKSACLLFDWNFSMLPRLQWIEGMRGGERSVDLLRRICMAEKNRILVVDDEDALRTVLSAELEGEGYRVSSAGDGDEAINILRSQFFDLILLDIKMPKVDGFEVLKFVKENHPTSKVIMLTGFADLKNAIESKKLGAEDFVSKPYDLVDLLTTVERVLSGL